MKKRVLITGGSGFIGSALCKKLIERGYDVTTFDLVPSNLCGHVIVGDILDCLGVKRAIGQTDYVFHLAGISDPTQINANLKKAFEINLDGTSNVSRACSRYNVPLIFASTCCVYGNVKKHPSGEESPCNPCDLNGNFKLTSEKIVKEVPRFNILRYGTAYGKGMRKALAVRTFIERALENKPLLIHGSGKQTRSLIYIDDLINANIEVLEREIFNETINIAGREELSVLKVADSILRETGSESKLKFVSDRLGQIMKEQIDISKAKRLLDWKPEIEFEEGLKKSVEWIKNER